MGLTKTDFMRGMQCPRMLWLDKNHPELKVIPKEVQNKLDLGNEFGDKAMGMFGPFEEMTAYVPNTAKIDKKKMVRNTKHHIEIGTENLCEAAFDWNGNYCAVDILHKVDGGYEMYEVKNTSKIGEQHVHDAGYQRYVIEKCGINLLGVYLVYHGDDEDNPFVPVDVSAETAEYAVVVEENLERLDNIRKLRAEPEIPMGNQCYEPYGCWYCEHCSYNNNRSS